MIELTGDTLTFRFPHLGSDAEITIRLMRWLRIPEIRTRYAVPDDLGVFQLEHVEDHAARLPERVVRRGGLIMPMWQADAMWIAFCGPPFHHVGMPAAVKVAAGGVNAVSGEPWRDGLHADPQDYCAVPRQGWLSGSNLGEGAARQFVAMPPATDHAAGEKRGTTLDSSVLQLAVTPPHQEIFDAWQRSDKRPPIIMYPSEEAAREMSLGPRRKLLHVVYPDGRPITDYNPARTLRVFVTILDAVTWRSVTGEAPPHRPPSAAVYASAGIPWSPLYETDADALPAAPTPVGLTPVGGAGALGQSDDDVAMAPLVRLAPRRVIRPLVGWTDD